MGLIHVDVSGFYNTVLK